MSIHAHAALAASFVSVALLGACDESPPPVVEDPGPIVAAMATPISLRADQEPADGLRIEVGSDRIRVDGVTVEYFAQKARKETKSESAPQAVVGFENAIKERKASAARIHMHVGTPYATMLRVVDVLQQSGAKKISFAVREPGQGASLAWMSFDNVKIADPPNADAPATETGLRWDAFVKHWEAINNACLEKHSIDCDAKQSEVASDGGLSISFLARGKALQVEFERVGGSSAPAKSAQVEEMLDGLAAPVREALESKTERAMFTWNFSAATESPSPLSNAFEPLCKTRVCPVSFRADSKTPAMRVISFVGAAFPKGSEAPELTLLRPTS